MYRRDSVSFPSDEPEEQFTIDVQPRAPSLIERLRRGLERGDPATRNLLVIALAVGMLAIVAVGLYGLSILLRETEGPRPPTGGPPVVETPGGGPLVFGDPSVTVPPVQPVTVTIKDQSLGVYSIRVQEGGTWPYDPKRSNQAAWVYGTLINYIFGLDAGNRANVELLESLLEGDPIVVHLSNGRELHFTFRERVRVPLDDVSLFDQRAPGVTLVLLGERGEDRLVARGDYNAEAETEVSGGVGEGVGMPIEVGPVRVTVQSGELRRGPLPNLLEGFAYYLVNFEIENLSEAPLDTSAFQMLLIDANDTRYNLSIPASLQGLGPLPPLLQPGVPAQATSGFLVPEALPGPVIWEFHPQAGSEEVARVQLPVQAAPPPAPPQAQVLVTAAEITPDGTAVSVRLMIGNPGQDAIVVNESDVSLTAEGISLGLREALPPPPWTIAPGGTLQVVLTFERPPADTALLTVLGYRFQLARLR